MALNESKGNMYDFVTHTWNTVKGECFHGCTYCYMKRWGKQNKVRFDEKELKTDLGENNFIFVGSSCDMFAEDIPKEWIQKTLNHCNQNNHYLFQTKNPKRIRMILPENSVICMTLETNRWYPEIMKNSPKPQERVEQFSLTRHKRYLTTEPIMDFDLVPFVEMIKQCNPEQVNIGADSGNNNLPEPSKEKVIQLIGNIEQFTKVVKKKNLGRLLK